MFPVYNKKIRLVTNYNKFNFILLTLLTLKVKNVRYI
jgi:hypothetical protein